MNKRALALVDLSKCIILATVHFSEDSYTLTISNESRTSSDPIILNAAEAHHLRHLLNTSLRDHVKTGQESDNAKRN